MRTHASFQALLRVVRHLMDLAESELLITFPRGLDHLLCQAVQEQRRGFDVLPVLAGNSKIAPPPQRFAVLFRRLEQAE